ncbi:MAG: PAS domain S-box protein [bacterium]
MTTSAVPAAAASIELRDGARATGARPNCREERNDSRSLLLTRGFQELSRASFDPLVISVDGEGCILGWSDPARAMFGWEQSDALGRSLIELLAAPGSREAFTRAITPRGLGDEGRAPSEADELFAVRKDGARLAVEIWTLVVPRSDDTTRAVVVRDRSTIARASSAERQLAALVESSDDAIIGKTLDGTIVSWNRGAEALYGYTAAEVVGRSIDLLVPPEDRHELETFLADVRRGERVSRREVTRVRKNGQRVFVDLTISPVLGDYGHVIGAFAMASNVSERRRADELFRMAVESSPVGMLMADERGIISMVNSQIESAFGFGRDELLGQPVEILLPARFHAQHAEDRTRYFENARRRAMGASRVLHAQRRDGSEFPVEIGLNPIAFGDRPHVLAAIVDVSERQRTEAEMARYRRELERANAELDQFAHAASHDLRSPLRAISSLSSWIAADLGGNVPPEVASHISLMQARVARLERLIDSLLEYARAARQPLPLDRVDTEAVARDTIATLAPPAGIETTLLPGLPTIEAPAVRFAQVLRNLLDNAYKHHDRATGRVVVGCNDVGDRFEFFVRDDGPGIPVAQRARVFLPFQMLRPRDEVEGSGLGLALAKKIVEHHGGTIRLAENEGRGACFLFTWPKRERIDIGSS